MRPAHLGVGERSPGSREAEGEGGEDFYMAQSGKRADLLIISRWEQVLAHVDATLPFPFWRVSLRRRRSPRSSERQVSRGDPWGEALARVSPTAPTSLLPGTVIFGPKGAARSKPGVRQDHDRALCRQPYPSSLIRQTSSRSWRSSLSFRWLVIVCGGVTGRECDQRFLTLISDKVLGFVASMMS